MEEKLALMTWDSHAGSILGWKDGEVWRATGIPYATANRGQVPRAAIPSTQPILATKWSPACPQVRGKFMNTILHEPMGAIPFDENCQRLSITLPANADSKGKLPVMVWIHGGSYTSGAGDAPMYDPIALVREQGVIVVSITYRLGLFGYLGGHDAQTPNLGLFDQIESLKWIQRNIEAFGGDPRAVTIFGESAGADAVAHLMIAEGSQGLFRRAIVQSAPFGLFSGRKKMAKAMAEVAAKIPAAASVEEIINAQARVVLAAQKFGIKSSMPFGTQYGFAPLPSEEEADRAWTAAARNVDVLVGSNSREAALFLPRIPALSAARRLPVAGKIIAGAFVSGFTRKIYGAGAEAFAKRHRDGGGSAYRYVLSWGVPGNWYAGAHSIDLPLLFPNRQVYGDTSLATGTPWTQLNEQGAKLRSIWAAFARTGSIDIGNAPDFLKIVKL